MSKPALLPYLIPASDAREAFEFCAAVGVMATDAHRRIDEALTGGDVHAARVHLESARERVGILTYAAHHAAEKIKAGGAE